MAKAGGKARSRQPAAQRPKKRKTDPVALSEYDDGDIFQDSDSDKGADDAAVPDGPQETPSEARLRLAKAYLQSLEVGADGLQEDEDGLTPAQQLAARLQQQAMEAAGTVSRQVADRVHQERLASSNTAEHSGRMLRCHWQSVTAVALSADDQTVYSTSKDGSIFITNVESGKRSQLGNVMQLRNQAPASGPTAPWLKKPSRQVSKGALLAAAVSDDGRFFAAGGGQGLVHLWDARSREHIKSLPGHRDAISGLAFRQGTHDLYSCAFDRTLKLWSCDDCTYVDTLFGHQAEVLALDVSRAERAVSGGMDSTCRVWKVADESQLIFRASSMAVDCCRYVTGTAWVTGSCDGSLSLWTQLKKKPAYTVANAHPLPLNQAQAEEATPGADTRSWVQSVAVCPGSDLVASGSGNGSIRLWAVRSSKARLPTSLDAVGSLPAPGYVNGLQIAHSARFVVAGLGREPRLGRWGAAEGRNGLLIHHLPLGDDS